MAITTESASVEAHNTIGIVEWYHIPLRRAYHVIVEELKNVDNGVTKEMALQMAFKALNDTAGPNGLIPTLLVFGACLRKSRIDHPSPSILARSKAIEKVMSEVTKLRINRQIKDALHQRNGPTVEKIHSLHINSKVWVWRKNKGWMGPYKLQFLG